MALKLRGSSQVKESSITFNKIKDLQSGKILGRAVDTNYDGKPLDPNNPESIVELGAEDVRRISGLWELDSPTLKGLNLNKHEGTGGNLSVEGIGNIDGDFSINNDKFKITALSGDIETLGTMTSQGDIKLTDSSGVDQHHLKSDGSLTSLGLIKSKNSFEVCSYENGSDVTKLLIDDNGNVTAAGIGDFGSTVTVGNLITLNGDSTDVDNGKISAKLLTLDAGGTDEKMIFTSAGLEIDKKLTVKGDLEVLGTTTTIDTQQLIVEDSLIYLAKNNLTDVLDIGFVGKSSAGYHGLVRDHGDSGIFKLFNTQQDLSSGDINLIDFANPVDTVYTVQVESTGSGNVYAIEGEQKKSLTLKEGSTYVFDWSSSPSHPVRFSETSNGTHSGGSEYLTGVTKEDNIFRTTITIESGAPDLHYYCQFHSGMGSSITVEPTATLGHLELGTLTATNLNGELSGNAATATKLAASFDFSITGDITAATVPFDGSDNVVLTATLDNEVIDIDNFQASAIVLESEGLDSNDNDTSIPTAAAVIDYVDSSVTSGGFDNVSNMDLKMGLNNSFVSVEEVILLISVSPTNEQNDSITLNPDIEDSFKPISQVYINGQKIRYAKDTEDQNTLYDYWFSDVSTINFKDGILNSDDNVEIRYYIQTSDVGGDNQAQGGDNQAQGGDNQAQGGDSGNQNNNPTYNASTANGETSVNEGDSLTINTTTTNVADGTTLYWTLSNAGDFAVSSGSFVITSNSGSFSVTPIADKTTEAVAETFTVSIRTVSSTEGVVVASVNNITINDTSQTPAYIVSTANGETSVNEGVALNMSVSTTNVDDGTTLYWTVSNAGDFDVSSGSFTITSDGGSFSVTPTADNTTEAVAETFTVSIRINDVTGTVVAVSSDISINDTSQTSAYTLSATNTTIAEDHGSTTITLSAPEKNVNDLVPYTISGVDTDDFRGNFLPTPIENISRMDASTGIETNNWNLLKMVGGPAAVTSRSGGSSGWSWNNLLDANASSYGEITHPGYGAYQYPFININIKTNSPLRYKVAKCFVISAPDGYPIGDFELWAHPQTYSKYHNPTHPNPDYTLESQGWILLKSGTSTSVNGQSDYFNLDNNDTLYTNYMFRFTNHTHAGQDAVRISGIALLDQERQSDFDFSNFSNNLRPRGQHFGSAVDCSADGNIFVVGERSHDGTNNNEGAVYTYQRSDVDGSIQRIAPVIKMPLSDSQAVAEFGSSVAISSDAQTLVVGAPKYDNDTIRTDSGVFFTYRWDSVNSEWDLLPSGDRHFANRFGRPAYLQYDYFSSSLSLSSDGKKLVVGSEGHSAGMGNYSQNRGAVYTYEWDESSSWNLVNTVEFNTDHEPNSHTYSYYGSSVAMSHDGNFLVVGAREYNGSTNNSGRVYTYEWDYVTDSWNLLTTINGPENQNEFGSDVALSNIGDILCVSSRQDIYRYKWNSINNQWDLFGDIIEFDDSSFSEINFQSAPTNGLAICLSEYGDFMYVGNENAEELIGNVHRYILLEQLDLTGNFVIDENKESTLDILPKTGLTLENTKNLELTLDGTSDSLIIDIEDSTVFHLNSSSVQVDEGQNILIKFSSDNIARGTVVPYVIEGDVTVNDFDPPLSDLTGEFIVGEKEDVSLFFKNDLITEGAEVFRLRIPSTDQSIDVNILDTSLTPTYTLETITEINGVETVITSIDEGSTFKFRLTHQHLPEGFRVPYEIKGVSADDFSPNLETFTGEFTIVDGTASYSTPNLNLNLDRLTEGDETVTFEITDHLQNTQSTDVTINDTSLNPSYSMDVLRNNSSILSTTVYRVKTRHFARYDSPQNYNYLHCTPSNENGIHHIPEVGEHMYVQSGETTGTRYYLGKIKTITSIYPNNAGSILLIKLGEPDAGVVTGDSVYISDLESHGTFYDEGYVHWIKIHEHVGTTGQCKAHGWAWAQVRNESWNEYHFGPEPSPLLHIYTMYHPWNPGAGEYGSFTANIRTIFEDDHILDEEIHENEIEAYDMVGRDVYTGNYISHQGNNGTYVPKPTYTVQMGTLDKAEVAVVSNSGTPENHVLTIIPEQDFIDSGSQSDHYNFKTRVRAFNGSINDVYYPHLSIKSADGTYDEFRTIFRVSGDTTSEWFTDTIADGFDVNDPNTGFKDIISRATINEIVLPNNEAYVTASITISTTNLEPGFQIPFSISGDGISLDDFDSILLTNTDISSNDNHQLGLTGVLTVPSDGSENNITITIKEDAQTEGIENFKFEITKNDSTVESIEIKITDDSLDSFVLSALSNGSPVSSINEGDEITFQVYGSGQLDNTSFNYELKGVSVDDFEPSLNSLTGTLTFQNETASLPLTFKNDISLNEGVENIIFETEDSRNEKQSISVNIIDSSVETTNVSILRNGSPILSGSHVKEGDVVKFVLGTNVANGTPIPYEIKGVNADDFNPTLGSLTGQFIAGSSEELELTIKNDATISEGDEVLTFEFTGSHGQISSVNLNVIDSSEQFTVVDILRNDSPISSGSDVNEGDNIKFVLDTNAPNGTSIPYEIKGVSVGDFNPNLSSLTGTLTVGSDEILSLNLKEDISFSEGDEVLTFEFTKPTSEISSVNLNVVDSSQEILTIDILKNGSSVLSGSHVNEGDVVKFVLNTNLSAGTLIPYEIKGVNADDFNPTLGSLTGQFMVGSSEELELTIKNDFSLNEGNEVLTFEFTNPTGVVNSVNLNVVDSSEEYVNVLHNIALSSRTVRDDPPYQAWSTSIPVNLAGEDFSDRVVFTLDTNLPNGTIIPYEIKGVKADKDTVVWTNGVGITAEIEIPGVSLDDFEGLSSLTGQFTVGSSEVVELILKEDNITEGQEHFFFEYTKPSGEIDDISVIVRDDSREYLNINILRNDSPISSGSAVNEGDNIKFVLDTNIPNKATSWEISGVSKTDFQPSLYYLNGSLTEGSNETLDLNLKEDLSFSEGDETLTFEYNDLDGVTQSINLLVTDSSYESYTLSTYIVSDAGTENEQEIAGTYLRNYDDKGQTLRVKLDTQNVPDGTTVNYNIQGTISGSDFVDYRQTYGSFTINNNQSYEDFKFDSSNEETFYLQLQTPLHESNVTAYVNYGIQSYKYYRIQQSKSWTPNWPRHIRIDEVEIIDDQNRNAVRDSAYSFTTTVSSDGSGIGDGSGDPRWGGRAGAYDGSTYLQWHNHYSVYPNDAMFYQFNFTTQVNVSKFRFYLSATMRDWKILGSNDGQNWDTLREYTNFPRVTAPTSDYPDGWITIEF